MAMRTLLMMLLLAVSTGVMHADDKAMTPEFANEGVDKAVEVLNDMVEKINALERAEDATELQAIMNSVKFRNVRKKYGKVELTDEHRAKLIDANVAVAEALIGYINRASLPYQLQQLLEQEASKEKITEGINKSKTLKEAMS